MSLAVYTTQSKELLKLSPKPFASGGEGSLYKVEMPLQWQNHVVKIYHPAKRTFQKQQKVKYLLQNQPNNTQDKAIVWPKDGIQDKTGNFLGLIMPMARGEKLQILCSSRLPRKLRTTWYRFHPNAPQSLRLRLQVCYNMVVAIQQIHALNKYILVDFKPDNVIIQPNGIVALVDLDSVEVVENGKKLFDAPVATPEYTPPEYYRNSKNDPTQQQAWDRFSLAVVCYKLLMGVHPFAATHKGKYASCTNLSQKIEQGLYVHHPKRKMDLLGVPPLHQKYHQLHPSIKQLFDRCFIAGHQQADQRPSASEWCSVLLQYLDVNSQREVPSVALDGVDYKLFFELKKQPPTPQEIISNLQKKEVIEIPRYPYEDFKQLKMKRQIGGLIVVTMIMIGVVTSYFFSWVIGGVVAAIVIALLISSYDNRIEKIASWTTIDEMEEEERFWKKQQQVYLGVEQYLREFYQQLKADYDQLIKKDLVTTQENIAYEIELEQKRLKQQLELEDKQAKQLLASERFEYEQLTEKYTQILRTYPEFSTAISPDAELAAIDFAQQEALAKLQNDLSKGQRKEEQQYEATIEQKEQLLQKIQRDAYKKINKQQQYLKLAKPKAIQKIKLLNSKNNQANFALINEENIASFITSFRDEIRDLLKRAKITSILDIKQVGKRTLILDSSKKVPIAPLRYFHIHDLVAWWQAVEKGEYELNQAELNAVNLEFESRLKDFRKKVEQNLSASMEVINKELEVLVEAREEAHAQLMIAHKIELQTIKEQYEARKAILEKITQAKQKEEQTIHERYNKKYQGLLDNATQKVEVLNTFIKDLFLKDKSLSDKKINQYKNNLQRYQKAINRLKEEHERLEEKAKAKLRSDHLRRYRLQLTLNRHILQMCYLQPLEIKR